MDIDYSKFVMKCNVDDCGKNEKHRCCVSCDSYEECKKKNWLCIYLDETGSPEDCIDLYLKREFT
jgi:hypothetical protein